MHVCVWSIHSLLEEKEGSRYGTRLSIGIRHTLVLSLVGCMYGCMRVRCDLVEMNMSVMIS
jgi:hypothetical protein